MPVRSPKWPFTPAAIENSPDEWGGVYVLWRGDTLLFIGSAPDRGRSINADLLPHQKGVRGPCTHETTHYSWALSQYPTQLQRKLFQRFVNGLRPFPAGNIQRTSIQ